ncbi:hypothetical protein [Halobellus rufus]|uniref:hypothetical protein n=1 Tax=Halobellus rufus TaxID=1448860 RepID=UPI00067894A3|nr:hypothetical protein [Halobellus rufus]
MSSVPHTPDLPLERDSLRRGAGLASAAVRTGLRNAKAASFWAAIVLPFTYVPLLAGGLTGGEALLFAGLVAVNALAFVAGHGYEPAGSQ